MTALDRGATTAAPAATRLPSARRPAGRAFAIAARRATADRASLAMTAVIYLFVLTAISSLWAAVAGDGTIGGYDSTTVFWYMVATEVVAIAVPLRLLEQTGNQIGSGEIAAEMVRPISPLPIRAANELGAAAPRTAVCLVLGLTIGVARFGLPPSPAAAALAVPSLFLGVALTVVNQYLFAATAFWLRDAGSAWFLHQKALFILGGLLIPLEVLPSGLRTAAWLTPFPLMAYAPARLASGSFEPWLLAAQLGWIIVVSIGAALAFRRGENRFVRTGG